MDKSELRLLFSRSDMYELICQHFTFVLFDKEMRGIFFTKMFQLCMNFYCKFSLNRNELNRKRWHSKRVEYRSHISNTMVE